MKREDVEALRQKIAVADAGGWGFVSVRPQQLSALLDIAEAVQDAPVVTVPELQVHTGLPKERWKPHAITLPRELAGKQVRLVRVGGGA